MTFPTVRSSANGEVASATTEWLIPLPSSVEDGDRIAIAVCCDEQNDLVDFVFNGDGSFSQVGVASKGAVRIELWQASANGDEGSTTVTVSAATAETMAYKVWVFADTNGALEATSSVSDTASASVKFAALTPSLGLRDYTWVGVFGANDEDVSTFSSGYSNTGSQPATETSPRIHWQRRNRAATTEAPDDAVLSANDQHVVLLFSVPGAQDVGLLMRRRRA